MTTFAKKYGMRIIVIIFCFFLAGCGQTGPLYLPKTDTQTKSA